MPSSNTVMIQVPVFLAVTTPFAFTLATLEWLLFQTGVLPELTSAFKESVFPFFIVADVRFNLMDGDFTVISHSFVTPSTVARILAVPCFAVIYPMFKETVNSRLVKKQLSANTNDYFTEEKSIIVKDKKNKSK